MKKFLKADVLKISENLLKKNCRPVNGSSFFYFAFLLSLAIISTVFTGRPASGQNREIINSKTFGDILYLRIDKARRDIKKSRQSENATPGTIYLDDYLEFILSLLDGDRGSFELYKENSSKRLNILKYTDDPVNLEFQAEINFHSFLLGIWHQENVYAFKKFALAYKQINRFITNTGNPFQGNKLKGMISVTLSAVPAEYDWFISLFGLPDDYKKGIKLIEDYKSFYNPETPQYLESVIIIALTRFLFGRDYDRNLTDLKNLSPKSFENPLIRLIYMLSASKTGRNTEIISMLKNYRQKPDEYKVCFYDYLYGEALLNRLDNKAGLELISFINCCKSETYLKSAYRKLAWNSLISGDTSSFYYYRSMVIDSGNLNADVDRQAFNELSSEGIPNVDLLKARLLFDGGYYTKAGLLLMDPRVREELKTGDQQLEYVYRLARVYHMKDETDKAIPLYRLTLEKGLELPLYYAASSALQLGTIYEERGDYTLAETWYLKVFEATEESYGARLRYSARQGLRRLKAAKATRD